MAVLNILHVHIQSQSIRELWWKSSSFSFFERMY